jgi:hypothetical protein
LQHSTSSHSHYGYCMAFPCFCKYLHSPVNTLCSLCLTCENMDTEEWRIDILLLCASGSRFVANDRVQDLG